MLILESFYLRILGISVSDLVLSILIMGYVNEVHMWLRRNSHIKFSDYVCFCRSLAHKCVMFGMNYRI